MKTLEFENYFMEPLRSMEKRATIRKSDKGLKEGDLVKCTFEWTDDYLIRRVRSVEKVKFKDLDNAHAWFEGYKHVDLLKHELQCIYPDMGNNTVLFQIKFKHPSESIGESEKEFRKKLLSIQKECNNSLRDMEYDEVYLIVLILIL